MAHNLGLNEEDLDIIAEFFVDTPDVISDLSDILSRLRKSKFANRSSSNDMVDFDARSESNLCTDIQDTDSLPQATSGNQHVTYDDSATLGNEVEFDSNGNLVAKRSFTVPLSKGCNEDDTALSRENKEDISKTPAMPINLIRTHMEWMKEYTANEQRVLSEKSKQRRYLL